ncbi:MAG: hypothetical protein HN919_19940 [Verrucomicrobia bacterium]|jgi:hypothetical protein|nr:hypothetical protein [Verrucomicrobiota bacterium]MBT7068577.1 hypothetical protein [Verrucomicrobiota bacterium]MBT7699555.1 hypothetical protein [Verrucomicrobiota bacterium]
MMTAKRLTTRWRVAFVAMLALAGAVQAQSNIAPLGTPAVSATDPYWSNSPQGLNDGNIAWSDTAGLHVPMSAGAAKGWITWAVDYDITSVKLHHCSAGAAYVAVDYTIEALNAGGNPLNDSDWTVVATITGNTTAAPTHSFASVTTKGIRMNVTKEDPSSGGTLRFEELEVYGVAGADNDPPTISTRIPADDESSANPTADLVATFNEGIALTGAGTITLTDTTDGSSSFSIDLSSLPDSDAAVTVSGSDLTIAPTVNLEGSKDYAVQISADAIEDLSSTPNAFAGILNNNDWNFTTGEPIYEISLTNGVSAPASGSTSAAHMLDDPFAYDPADPSSQSPAQAWANPYQDNLFITDTANNWVRFEVIADGTYALDYLDVWGRSNGSAAENARHQTLVISFYTSTDGSGSPIATSASWSGISDAPEAYGRFDVTALIADATERASIRSFEIDQASVKELHLYEIRAAGSEVAGDTTAPGWEGIYPQVDTENAAGATARAQIDEAGAAYYVVLADGASAPSSAQVKAGVDYDAVTVLASGNITLTASTEGTDAFSGLSAGTAYDVYFVAEDDEGTPNLQTTPEKIDLTTTAPDTTAPAWVTDWPKVDTESAEGALSRAQINEAGTAYYVVLADGATAPDSTEVKAGTGDGGAAALASGSISLTASNEVTDAFSGLSASTAYDVYFVAEDDEGTPNIQASPTLVEFTAGIATMFITPTAEFINDGSYANRPSGTMINSGLAGSNEDAVHDGGSGTGANCWMSSGAIGGGGQRVTVDLGASYDLTKIYLWNYSEGNALNGDRSVENFTVTVSDDNVTFVAPTTGGSQTATATPNGAGSFPISDTLDMTASGVRYVRFTVNTAHGGTGSFVGIGDVGFEGALTPDTTAPGWDATYPHVDTETASGATARGQIDEDGTAYYVVLADGATAPDSAEVKAGTGDGGAAALASGSINLTANTEGTDVFSGLSDSTAYDVYFVAEDDEGTPNLQASPTLVEFTTTTPDTTAPAWEATYPQVDSGTYEGATARAQINEIGTAYYVVLADGASAPSAVQVKAGNDVGDTAALASGSIALGVSSEGTDAFTGLSPSTAYDAYFVAEDDEGTPNIQTSPTLVDFSTGTSVPLSNGGFEDPDVTANSSVAAAPASLNPTGWNGAGTGGQSLNIHNDGSVYGGAAIAGAHGGDQYVVLHTGGSNPSGAFSSVDQDTGLLWSDLTAGDALTVTAWTTYRSDVSSGSLYFRLNAVDGSSINSGLLPVTNTAAGTWTKQTWFYTVQQADVDTASNNSWGAVNVEVEMIHAVGGGGSDNQTAIDDVGLDFVVGGGDTSAPVWAGGYPKVDSLTLNGATAQAEVDEEGTAYFVVLADAAAPPSSAQVKAGTDAGDNAVQSDSIALTANTEGSALISGLVGGTSYDVYFVAEDAILNIEVSPTLVEITLPSDSTPPTISSRSPGDDAVDVFPNTSLVITFSEDVQAGTGDIVIEETGVGTFATIPVGSATISGATVSVARAVMPGDFAPFTDYHVTIAAGVIEDLAGNAFAGIATATEWNFTTGEEVFSLPLSNAGGGTAWDTSAPGNLLNDGFSYDQYAPTTTSPNHTWAYPPDSFYFSTQADDAQNYWFAELDPGTNSVDFIDVWGNNNAAAQGLHEQRSHDLVLSFYWSTDATGTPIATSAPWNGVVWNGDNANPTHGRFDVTALIDQAGTRNGIRSIRIDHSSGSNVALELYEVRAAGTAFVPTGTLFQFK